MPTFATLPPPPPLIPLGVHLGKVVKATERTSANCNQMISMTIELPPPGRERLPCILTFVEPAKPVINAFCASAGLIRPTAPDVQVELSAYHCLGRYLISSSSTTRTAGPKSPVSSLAKPPCSSIRNSQASQFSRRRRSRCLSSGNTEKCQAIRTQAGRLRPTIPATN
jgi:hypothetical protein